MAIDEPKKEPKHWLTVQCTCGFSTVGNDSEMVNFTHYRYGHTDHGKSDK